MSSTERPWKIKSLNDGYYSIIHESEDGTKFLVAKCLNEDNAHLIAILPEMLEFIQDITECHLQPLMLLEHVEADWVKIITPLVDFMLEKTPEFIMALAKTVVVEGYGRGGGEINPDALIITDSQRAIDRFTETWEWLKKAFDATNTQLTKSRFEKGTAILEKIKKTRNKGG